MTRPHPASLILLGLALLLAASSRSGPVLFLVGSVLGLVALAMAASHFRLLLQRSRWLLLTLLVMFGWMTPGTPVPFVFAATQEGLALAGESVARLLIALSIVALILKALPAAELVAGIRSLLGPLVLLKMISRDRIAVRLALTLNEVEAARSPERDEACGAASTLVLPATGIGATDIGVGVLTAALILFAWLV